MPRRHQPILLLVLLLLLGGARVDARPPVSVHMESDRLWLNAPRTSLEQVLQGFAHAGVRVHVDPDVRAPVDTSIEGEYIDRALAKLFEPFGYVLIWDVVKGPLGEWPRLAEIHLFRPGRREQARTLPMETTLRVMQMPDGSGSEYIADEILIGFAPGADPQAIRVLIRQLGGTVVDSLPELGIYRIRLPPGTNIPALVAQLARNPLVAEVEPNYAYRLPDPLGQMGAASAAASAGGAASPRSGARAVAVLDSGLTMLSDLQGLIAGGFNALNPSEPYTDTAGHGTQMALIATGAVVPDGGATGERAGVPVVSIRAFDDNGVTSNFAQMRSLTYAVEQGATVLNMSWGSPVDSAFLEHAVAAAAGEGLVVVASVGNEPTNQALYPAAYDQVIGVAATLADGSPWPQSNYGDFVFVAAPGQAAFPVGYQGDPGGYAGTSIAGAYVSYALGLYFEKHPGATAQDAARALEKAVTTDGSSWDPRLGYGVLDADALQRLLQ